jgi:CelD/BcsL family acetyltransferase involved in cellulose biosynthesis
VAGPTTVCTSVSELTAIEAEWRALAISQPSASYFVSPDWVLSWWETEGDGAHVEAGVWRDDAGRLEAVVPLARYPHRLHPVAPLTVPTWTNLGSGVGAADHCGWAVRASRAEDVRAWLAGKLASGSMILDSLDPEAGAALVPAGAQAIASSACPRVAIPAAEAEIGGSAKFRKQLRAYRRKIERLGVTFRWIGPAEMTADVVDTVLDLHETRRAAAGWASMFNPDRAALHRRLIERSTASGGPAAVLAERDGQPVAVLYGFRWRDVFAYYQTGWVADLAAANLATVLVAEAIRLAGADGATMFDFLRGAEAYKYRFGAHDRVDQTWLVPVGVRGRLLRAKYRWKQRHAAPQPVAAAAAAVAMTRARVAARPRLTPGWELLAEVRGQGQRWR